MLVRGARRKLHRNVARNLQPAFEQLQLPWLCPALHTYPRRQQSSHPSSIGVDRKPPLALTTSTHPPRTLRTAPKYPPGRTFAYAVQNELSPNEYIPFETPLSEPSPSPSWRSSGHSPNLPVFDPSSPLVVADSLKSTPRTFRSNSLVGIAAGGLDDIHQILQACLQVGLLDRATAAVRRLCAIYKPDSSEIIDVHNAYIRALVTRIIITKDQEMLRHVAKWIEVEMRMVGTPITGTTLALGIQASLYDVNEKRIGRSIRRYIALSKDYDVYDEMMAVMSGLLSDHELFEVTQVSQL